MSGVKGKIVKYFIKSSPVGEVHLVLKDLCNIVDKELLEAEDIKQALREHFEQHRQHVKLEDGRVAMVSTIGRNNAIVDEEGAVTAAFVYFDQAIGVKFSFDPSTMQATLHGTESDFPEQLDEQWAGYK